MAARIRPQIQAEVRARIKTSQLLNRLQDYIDKKIRLDQGQIRAIEILLRKALPDLSSVEQTGERQKPVVIVTGVPRPWDKPIGDTISVSHPTNDINGLDTNTPSDSDGSVH